MCCQIAGREVVPEIIQRCDDWMREEMRPCDGRRSIKLSIYRYGEKSRDEGANDHNQ
jgi:hypothetical protein